jgi:hypothetical protein
VPTVTPVVLLGRYSSGNGVTNTDLRVSMEVYDYGYLRKWMFVLQVSFCGQSAVS